MKYIEKRYLEATALRTCCIENDWYTHGDNEQYSSLFAKLRDKQGRSVKITTAKLAELAKDIKEHSRESVYEIEDYMFVIARYCYTTFEAVK